MPQAGIPGKASVRARGSRAPEIPAVRSIDPRDDWLAASERADWLAASERPDWFAAWERSSLSRRAVGAVAQDGHLPSPRVSGARRTPPRAAVPANTDLGSRPRRPREVVSAPSRRRSTKRPYERAGFQPDRTAMWAVLLGILLVLVAVTTSHAAQRTVAARRVPVQHLVSGSLAGRGTVAAIRKPTQ